ncbi:MAG: DUF4062 domain-containing protein [Acidobacteriota bacterium]
MVEAHREPISWEKVHIFVSSTFNDMHAERDYLVKRVFPELQDWCERRKLRLVDIDLRWGVTEADASSKRAVEVCLERIDGCRPFFICFLGQRHGWTPGEEGISEDTFDKFPGLRDSLHPAASVTELEIRHAILKPFSSRDPEDRNTLIEYQPSECAFFYFRDPRYLKDLRGSLRQLRCTYSDHFGPEDETDREFHQRELSRRALSALRKLIRPAAAEHRRLVYRADWRDELRTPELAMPLERSSVEETSIGRWRDQWNRFAHLDLTDTELSVPEEKQSAADGYNAALTRGRLAEFRSLEEARGQFPSGSDLARIIQHDLQQAILTRFPKHAEVEEEGELQKEIDQQEQFLFGASEGFIKREGDFAELDYYVESDSNKLFVLTAAGGMGKSTLLANWVERYRTRIEGRADHSVHFRFIGQSDGTTTVYSLLRLLLHEIKEVDHKLDEEIPLDPIKLRNEWPALLEAIGKRGKTVILIDALNQLESGLTDVGWLPRQLPENIKLIVSFKRGDASAEELYGRFSEGNQVRLSEVKPFEDLDHRRRLVRAYLSQYLKELDGAHLETLINLRGAENPLYLNVVLSELRVFGAYGNLAAKIHSDFGDNPVSAFVQVLARLENDPAYSPIDPKRAVPLLFGLLAHARRGLSVDELTSLFIQALGFEETKEGREAAADTVNLFLRQVRSFLARREGRYDFFFESFKLAAQQCYVGDADGTEEPSSGRSYQEWHRFLANYFQSLPTWQEAAPSTPASQPARQPTRRKVAELPHHLIQAEQWEGLERTLCHLDFLEAKCAAGLVFELATDFGQALRAIPPTAPSRALLRLIEEALRRDIHFIARHREEYPQALFQCLWNTCWWYDCPEAATHYETSEGPWSRPGPKLYKLLEAWRTAKEEVTPGFRWVRSLRPPYMRLGGSQRAVFTGHTRWVTSVAWVPDGQRIVSGARDKTVRVWDVESSKELACFRGHDRPVTSVACSADCSRVASGSEDKTVRVWDIDTGLELACLHCQTGSIESVTFSPNGRHIACGADDGTLQVWDVLSRERILIRHHGQEGSGIRSVAYSPHGRHVASAGWESYIRVWSAEAGEEVIRLDGHNGGVSSVAYSPDGSRIVSGGEDNSIRVWDVNSGRELLCLLGHEYGGICVTFSPDGVRIISGANDRTVRVWEVETGKQLACLEGHTDSVSCVAHSPHGSRIVSGSKEGDQTIRLWDLGSTETPCRLLGHDGWVWKIVFSADSRLIASAGWDKTVQVWDAVSGVRLACLRGHTDEVRDVTFSPSGRHLVSKAFDLTIRVWDVERSEELLCLCDQHEINRVVFSPDGRWFAATPAGSDKVFLWDTLKSQRITGAVVSGISPSQCPYRGQEGGVNCFAFSPNGTRMVSGGADGTVMIWNIEGGGSTLLRGHKKPVRCVAYSPDGKRIVSGGDDRTVRVWDAASHQQLACLRGHANAVESLTFSRDNRQITSRSSDRILVWDLQRGDCIEVIKNNTESAQTGAKCYRWRSVPQHPDAVIEDTRTGEVIWRFPKGLDLYPSSLVTNPSGQVWVGMGGDRMYLLALEGEEP